MMSALVLFSACGSNTPENTAATTTQAPATTVAGTTAVPSTTAEVTTQTPSITPTPDGTVTQDENGVTIHSLSGDLTMEVKKPKTARSYIR